MQAPQATMRGETTECLVLRLPALFWSQPLLPCLLPFQVIHTCSDRRAKTQPHCKNYNCCRSHRWLAEENTARTTTRPDKSDDIFTCEREHKRPGAVPGVGVIPLLTTVHVDAQPGRGDRGAPQLLLPELGERLEQLLEPLGAEVVFGWRSHL